MTATKSERPIVTLLGPAGSGKTTFRKQFITTPGKPSSDFQNISFQSSEKNNSEEKLQLWEFSPSQQQNLNLLRFYLTGKAGLVLFFKAGDVQKQQFQQYEGLISGIKQQVPTDMPIHCVINYNNQHPVQEQQLDALKNTVATWLSQQAIGSANSIHCISAEDKTDALSVMHAMNTDIKRNETKQSGVITSKGLANQLIKDLGGYSYGKSNNKNNHIRKTAVDNCITNLKHASLKTLVEFYPIIRRINEIQGPSALKKLTQHSVFFEFLLGTKQGSTSEWQRLLSGIKNQMISVYLKAHENGETIKPEISDAFFKAIDNHSGAHLPLQETHSRQKLDRALATEADTNTGAGAHRGLRAMLAHGR